MESTPDIPPESEEIFPRGLEPNPVPLEFTKRVVSGRYVALKASYTNEDMQPFVVTIAAETKHCKPLNDLADEMKVWLHAIPENGSVTQQPDPEEGPVTKGREPDEIGERLLAELRRMEDDVTGSRIAFEVTLAHPQWVELGGPNVTFLSRIDPTVLKNHGKSYTGPRVAIVGVQPNKISGSKVQLKGVQGGDPVIGSAVKRDTLDGYCRVVGLAKSAFTIDGLEGKGNFHEI